MRRIRTAALLLGIGLFAGCETLADIEEGVCGNQVLEAGEECDSPHLVPGPYGDGKFTCITPDKENACHFTCAKADGSDTPCPSGMTCGDDQVCRMAAAVFEAPETLVTSGAIRLQAANFDGDRWLDLVAVSQEGIAVHYLDEDARWDTSFEMSSTPTVPAVMYRSADPAAPGVEASQLPGLVVNIGTGLAVLTGRPERTLLPKFYDAFTVKGFDWFVAADVLDQSGDELVVIGEWPNVGPSLIGTSFEESGAPRMLQALPGYSGIEGAAAVARLHTQTRCESVAAMFTGGKAIHVFSPCVGDGWNTSEGPDVIPLVDSAEREAWGGVLAVHLDDDDHLDLVVGSQDMNGDNRRIEFYLADPETADPAEFVPSLEWPPLPVVTRDAACDPNLDPNIPRITSFPLAIGDINQDGKYDFIDASGMLLSRGQDGWLPRECPEENEWVKARIGRFNGDGFPDVAVVSRRLQESGAPSVSGPMSIEFQIGAGGGLFNPFIYPAMGEVADMFAGDFDGDVIDDLVVRERTAEMPGAPVQEDRLNLFFGSFAGGPEEPVPIGTLGSIKKMAVGKTVESDGLDDIIIVSEPGADMNSGVKIMPGSTSRRILSPLFLLREVGTAQKLNRPERLCVLRSVDGAGQVSNRIVAVADDTYDRKSRLWVAALDGNADLSKMDILPIPDEYPDPEDGLLLAALDLAEGEGGARAEGVVAFLPATGGETTGVVIGTGGAGITLPDAADDTGLRIRYTADGMEAPMLVNDVDGNGWADIALLLDEDQGFVIFWNHMAGCDTGICADDRSALLLSDFKLASAEGAPPLRAIDMAFLDVDADDQKELAVLLDRGVILFDVVMSEGGASFEPLAVDADGIPRVVEGTQQLRGRSLAAFDADHDGLDDLIVGTDNEIFLLLAKWVAE